jgi:hypothetical protein
MTITPNTDPVDEPREFLLARLAGAVVDLLAHEFEEIECERAGHADGDPRCPVGQSAEVAHRIGALCRRLGEQLQVYERCEHLCRQAQAQHERQERELTPSDGLPF